MFNLKKVNFNLKKSNKIEFAKIYKRANTIVTALCMYVGILFLEHSDYTKGIII